MLEEGEATTPEMALRFVSKIPMVPGTTLFPGLFDVWLTAQVKRDTIYQEHSSFYKQRGVSTAKPNHFIYNMMLNISADT